MQGWQSQPLVSPLQLMLASHAWHSPDVGFGENAERSQPFLHGERFVSAPDDLF
jgi:hypothetical protein